VSSRESERPQRDATQRPKEDPALTASRALREGDSGDPQSVEKLPHKDKFLLFVNLNECEKTTWLFISYDRVGAVQYKTEGLTHGE
jgi:hypothetical protein